MPHSQQNCALRKFQAVVEEDGTSFLNGLLTYILSSHPWTNEGSEIAQSV